MNGALTGWPGAAGRPAAGSVVGHESRPGHDDAGTSVLRLATTLGAADLIALAARCDAALIWALVQTRLRAGAGLADALAGTLDDVAAAGATGRFNMLLTDGELIAATAAGDTLCFRRRPEGIVVASEPSDDEPDWREVPDRSVLEATTAAVRVRALS